jgi:hypothetical protein
VTLHLLELHHDDGSLVLLNLNHVVSVSDGSYGTKIRTLDGSVYDVRESTKTIRDMLKPKEDA